MPNWCSNYIKISGDESNMKPIYDLLKSEVDDLFMSTLVPENGEFEKIKDGGHFLLSPYVEYYGTKWDFKVTECDTNTLEPTLIDFSVSTAWSPPEPFCKRLSKKYGVDVEISFFEGGANFAGRSRFSNGKEIESLMYTYREGMYYLETETFWGETYSDLEWMFCENPNITFDEVLGQMYPFVKDENDIKELNELYHNFKVDETTGE